MRLINFFFFLAVIASSVSHGAPTKLRVALFPYLPSGDDVSNEALRARLEREFETANPDIDVEIRKFDPVNDDFYDPLWLAGLLRAGDGVDLLEIDTVLLGSLLDLEAIAPWDADLVKSDWQPIAAEACRIRGQIFGVPHWMCGHFIMTPYEAVAKAETADELVQNLERAKEGTRNLAGNLLGSWNTAALYIDSWADSRSDADLSAALTVPLDPNVLRQFVRVAQQGAFNGTNPCIDKTYDDNPNLAAEEFGRGEADALLGWSERLHYAVRAGADSKKLFVSSACLGDGNDPLWFVDAIVLRNDGGDEQPVRDARRRAAKKFVTYLNAPSTFEWIHSAEDLGNERAPRYLIPATKSAYRTGQIGQDPVMMQIQPLLGRGTFFPRHQLPGARRAIGADVKAAWAPK